MATSFKYKSTGGKDRPPDFSWGGLITFLVVFLIVVVMIVYETYFK